MNDFLDIVFRFSLEVLFFLLEFYDHKMTNFQLISQFTNFFSTYIIFSICSCLKVRNLFVKIISYESKSTMFLNKLCF